MLIHLNFNGPSGWQLLHWTAQPPKHFLLDRPPAPRGQAVAAALGTEGTATISHHGGRLHSQNESLESVQGKSH